LPRFEPKTFSFFLERMSDRVVARTELTDLEEGGVIHTLLSAFARELDDISFQMVNLQRIWDLDTATGEDLDDRAQDLNPTKLVRQGATGAAGSVVFSRAGTIGTVAIPTGSIVRVPDGGPEYETTLAGSILAGGTDSAVIPILALEAGTDGNVDAGTITQMNAVTGVETVINGAATLGGQGVETDAQFRTRIKTFLRSLPRGTPDALKFAVLDVEDPDFGRVVSAEVFELTGVDLGVVIIYIDDGAGTVEQTDSNIGAPETVVASAAGGEVRLLVDNVPVKEGAAFDVEINAVPQVQGVDYTLNLALGQITLDPTVFPTGLTPADSLIVEYTWYIGLIEVAQKVVDGDPADRTNFPGYRAAGTEVFVRAPTVFQQIVEGAVVVESDFIGQADEVRDSVRSAINRYINGLGINGDVILSELIFQAQSVTGVFDISFTTPTGNVVIGDGELARVTDANIDLT